VKKILVKILSSKYLAFTIASTSTRSVQALTKQSPLLWSSYFDLPVLSIIEVLSIDSTVAISYLSFEELAYLDEKKEKAKKDEVRDEEGKQR
jgi:hypothetical protein